MCETNIYIQECTYRVLEGEVGLTMINPTPSPLHTTTFNSTLIWFAQAYNNSSLGQLQPSGTDMRKVETLHAPGEANVQTKPRILLPELFRLEPPPQ